MTAFWRHKRTLRTQCLKASLLDGSRTGCCAWWYLAQDDHAQDFVLGDVAHLGRSDYTSVFHHCEAIGKIKQTVPAAKAMRRFRERVKRPRAGG